MKLLNNTISDFLSHCRYEKNLSEKTIKAYTIDLTQFENHFKLKRCITDITSIDKSSLREYLQSISSLKPKTIKRKIASIKSMFNFLEYEDEISINPFRKMKIKIKEHKDLPRVMSLVEIEKMIRVTYSLKDGEKINNKFSYYERLRDICVIEMLFATGLRVSELAGLRNEHLDLETGQLKVKGKGNKERIIQVCNTEILEALKVYHSYNYVSKTGGYFFINRLGKKLSEQSIRYLVKSCAKKAGITRNITPHVFRHSFATLLLEENVDIKYIQHMLGHSSIMVTQIYTHVNKEKQKEILSLQHPRRNIKI